MYCMMCRRLFLLIVIYLALSLSFNVQDANRRSSLRIFSSNSDSAIGYEPTKNMIEKSRLTLSNVDEVDYIIIGSGMTKLDRIIEAI